MDLSYWTELALYAGIVQGLFLASFLPQLTKNNKEANKMLAILLFLASVSTFLFLNTVFLSNWSIHVHAFLDTIPFIFAPLFYLYIRKFLFHSIKVKRTVIHFVPALLHSCYALSTFRFSEAEYMGMLQSGALKGEWGFIFMGLSILIFAYWLASVRLMIKFRKEKEKMLSYVQNLHYLSVLLGALLITYLVGIVFSLDFFFGVKIFSFTGSNLGWVIIPVFIYLVSYFALVQPDAMSVRYEEKKKTFSRIHGPSLATYKSRLEEVMQKEKLYLNPLLKLSEVAKAIQLDSTRLSWLINEEYACNFYDFVNQYRIHAFLEKLNNNEHKKHTLLSLALEVGFNSKTTFNKSFKHILQDTPSAYVKKQKEKECFSPVAEVSRQY